MCSLCVAFGLSRRFNIFSKVPRIFTSQQTKQIHNGVNKNRLPSCNVNVKKGKVVPYSLLSVGLGADSGVRAVSPQVARSHPPGDRLPLVSARPAVTFPAEERHHPLAGTKLYCLVTEAHACEQLAQGCYLEANRPRFEPATFRIASERSTVKPHRPQM